MATAIRRKNTLKAQKKRAEIKKVQEMKVKKEKASTKKKPKTKKQKKLFSLIKKRIK